MSLKKELQQLNNKLDKCRHKLAAAQLREDRAAIAQTEREIVKLNKQIGSKKGLQTRQVSGKGAQLKALAFHRVLTKAEQADMGKLKKSVRGLIVVHPSTALGRDMGIAAATGYAPAEF